MGDYLVLLIIAVAVIAVLLKLRKAVKGGGCSGCSEHCSSGSGCGYSSSALRPLDTAPLPQDKNNPKG